MFLSIDAISRLSTLSSFELVHERFFFTSFHQIMLAKAHGIVNALRVHAV